MKFCVSVFGFALIGFVVFSNAAGAQDNEAILEEEGLVEYQGADVDVAYVLPGVDWSGYSSFYLAELYVTPEARDATPRTTSGRRSPRESWILRDNDIEEIIELFEKEIVRELTRDDVYSMVEEPGPGSLIFVPTIIDIVLMAPIADTRRSSMGRGRTFTEYGGALTIAGVIADGGTGQVLARFADQRYPSRMWRENTEMRNKSDAREIFRAWGRQIRKRLQEIQSGEIEMP